jgi:hypothetical protein
MLALFAIFFVLIGLVSRVRVAGSPNHDLAGNVGRLPFPSATTPDNSQIKHRATKTPAQSGKIYLSQPCAGGVNSGGRGLGRNCLQGPYS